MPLEAPRPASACLHDPADWLDAIDARVLAADPTWSSAEPPITTRLSDATRTQAWRELAVACEQASSPDDVWLAAANAAVGP